jgi:hypothetical protein
MVWYSISNPSATIVESVVKTSRTAVASVTMVDGMLPEYSPRRRHSSTSFGGADPEDVPVVKDEVPSVELGVRAEAQGEDESSKTASVSNFASVRNSRICSAIFGDAATNWEATLRVQLQFVPDAYARPGPLPSDIIPLWPIPVSTISTSSLQNGPVDPADADPARLAATAIGYWEKAKLGEVVVQKSQVGSAGERRHEAGSMVHQGSVAREGSSGVDTHTPAAALMPAESLLCIE